MSEENLPANASIYQREIAGLRALQEQNIEERERNGCLFIKIAITSLLVGMALGDTGGPVLRDAIDRWTRPAPRPWTGITTGSTLIYAGPGVGSSVAYGNNVWVANSNLSVGVIISGRMMVDVGPVDTAAYASIAPQGS